MLTAAIALLIVAVALVAAELFLPSHGLLATLALLTAIGSVACAYRASPGLALVFVLGMLIATPVAFYWMIRLYPTTPMGKRVMLTPPAGPDSTAAPAFEQESVKLEKLVGQRGTATTLLRPAGIIDIAGQRVDAISESDMIPAGTAVEVIQVSGLKVIVKAAG